MKTMTSGSPINQSTECHGTPRRLVPRCFAPRSRANETRYRTSPRQIRFGHMQPNSLFKCGIPVPIHLLGSHTDLGVEPKIGGFYPQNGWVYFMEKPMNKWMIWGVFPLFLVQHPFLETQDFNSGNSRFLDMTGNPVSFDSQT